MSEQRFDDWIRICRSDDIKDGQRLHFRINQRYISVFRENSQLLALDSICHHAGGPLTLGVLEDIEDLGLKVVLCPWHRFMVSLKDGKKVYKSVEIKNGKPVVDGWKIGKKVQRSHQIQEKDTYIFIKLDTDPEDCSSDRDSCSQLCAQSYAIFAEV